MVIKPIYKKKGDIDDPDNYRGITLVSCLSKLFTAVLNARLTKFLNDNSIILENQAGFRDGYSTADHIFTLKSIIDLYLSQGHRLFCAFMEYRKAFDSVWRIGLWQNF